MTKKDIQETIGVGRRKTAVASVRLRPGKGQVKINDREFENYFPLEYLRDDIKAPLTKLSREDAYDIIIRLSGGGIEAQAKAARLGIARALVAEDEERRKVLKDAGYLRRDPRRKERKKYGLAGARKRYQFSKR